MSENITLILDGKKSQIDIENIDELCKRKWSLISIWRNEEGYQFYRLRCSSAELILQDSNIVFSLLNNIMINGFQEKLEDKNPEKQEIDLSKSEKLEENQSSSSTKIQKMKKMSKYKIHETTQELKVGKTVTLRCGQPGVKFERQIKKIQ